MKPKRNLSAEIEQFYQDHFSPEAIARKEARAANERRRKEVLAARHREIGANSKIPALKSSV